MKGLVIEGGGRRGIFAAGVLDCLAQHSLSFDYIIGVSSGAQAALDFAAGQNGRTKSVIIPGNDGWTGIGIKKMLASDLDKIIYEFPYKKIPFDFNAFFHSGIKTEIVATDCATGKAKYFSETRDEKRLLDMLCASCSLPLIYPAVKIDGAEYLDGSIADAIPFNRAFNTGCDKVLVIMSKPVTEQATDYSRYRYAIKKFYRQAYPVLTERLFDRLDRYKAQCEELEIYEKLGKALVIRPEETLVSAFDMNKEKLNAAYDISYRAAEKRIEEIKDFLK